MVGGNCRTFGAMSIGLLVHWSPLKSDPSRQFLESRNELNKESCSQKLCWEEKWKRQVKPETLTETRQWHTKCLLDRESFRAIQKKTPCWLGNGSRIVEIIDRIYEAPCCKAVSTTWKFVAARMCGGSQWHHRWPQEACFQFREIIILYYVAFISVACISCFLIRCLLVIIFNSFYRQLSDQFTPGSVRWEREAVVTVGWDEQIHQCTCF